MNKDYTKKKNYTSKSLCYLFKLMNTYKMIFIIIK